MKKPIAIDLFCGLGGWTQGLMAEGYRVIGYDIEAHDYGDGKRYPSELIIQDVLTIHGSQFKDAALIVASPPCQEFSYMAMPWSRAKAIAVEYRTGKRDVKKLTALFDACFRIQKEAIEAAGHFIPMVVENVRGAQPWVGRAKWNFGSYYLWGDVPALMPITQRSLAQKLPVGNSTSSMWSERPIQRLGDALKENGVKAGDRNKGAANGEHKWTASFAEHLPIEGFKTQGMNWSDRSIKGQDFTRIAGQQAEGVKVASKNGRRSDIGNGTRFTSQDCGIENGVKGFTPNGGPLGKNILARKDGSKSKARKAASAAIAKIPFPLARWIAHVWKPKAIKKSIQEKSLLTRVGNVA